MNKDMPVLKNIKKEEEVNTITKHETGSVHSELEQNQTEEEPEARAHGGQNQSQSPVGVEP